MWYVFDIAGVFDESGWTKETSMCLVALLWDLKSYL